MQDKTSQSKQPADHTTWIQQHIDCNAKQHHQLTTTENMRVVP